MDHMMPEMDGMEATRLLRESGYKDPIVALTANAVAGQSDIFLQNGFDAFISKPIDIRQLNSVLNKLIRDKQPQEVLDAVREQEALEHNDHDIKSHVDVMLLESFIRDARKTVAELEELYAHEGNFESMIKNDDYLHKYITTIHGMKSSLWNIGENVLSGLASKLELYGRERNFDNLKTFTPEFLKELRLLLNNIEVNKKNRINDSLISNEDTAELHVKLQEIQKMCADYNRKDALEIISGIKTCTKETRVVLDKLNELVLHSEFEAAEGVIEAYIKVI